MGQHSKEIKRRMRSVSNTKKMTRAMEMTAAAKMRKAQAATLASREYATTAWKLLLDVSKNVSHTTHPLLNIKDEVHSVLVIHISSDKGLCGALNAAVNKSLVQFLQGKQGIKTELITIGMKGLSFAKREDIPVTEYHPNWANVSEANHVANLMSFIVQEYLQGKYDAVYLSYTDFESTLKQTPHIRRLLPFILQPDELLGHIQGEPKTTAEKEENEAIYEYEPDAKQLLSELIPRLLESQLYQAVLESQASEHSARMVAMKNATESAGEILDSLQLQYNKARQAGITQEIIEIMSTQSSIQ